MMGDHWAAVASALAGTSGLLGYEMINEPWPSRGADDSWRALSDTHTLLPLYEALHARVRAVDDETPFFFEPLVIESYEVSTRIVAREETRRRRRGDSEREETRHRRRGDSWREETRCRRRGDS